MNVLRCLKHRMINGQAVCRRILSKKAYVYFRCNRIRNGRYDSVFEDLFIDISSSSFVTWGDAGNEIYLLCDALWKIFD
jgi:hypothetical protein